MIFFSGSHGNSPSRKLAPQQTGLFFSAVSVPTTRDQVCSPLLPRNSWQLCRKINVTRNLSPASAPSCSCALVSRGPLCGFAIHPSALQIQKRIGFYHLQISRPASGVAQDRRAGRTPPGLLNSLHLCCLQLVQKFYGSESFKDLRLLILEKQTFEAQKLLQAILSDLKIVIKKKSVLKFCT